ncbi:MAG: ATP-binding protein [Spirochaetaceae bacterium]
MTLFFGAVVALQKSLPPGSYHSRLSPASLHIDGDPADGRLFLADTEMIRPAVNAPGDFPVWAFCAPEQTDLVEEPVGVASNIYTIGAIGSYLCGGLTRILKLSAIDLAEAIVRDPIEPEIADRAAAGEVTGAGSGQRSFLTRIIRRATAKNPGERYGSLAELKAELSLLRATWDDVDLSLAPILIGRKYERRALDRFLHGIRSGEARFLLVTGEPGQGKSFLWRSVSDTERRESEMWTLYKSPQTGTVPFAGAASLLRQLITAARARTESESRVEDALGGRTIDILETISPGIRPAIGYEPLQADESHRVGLTGEAELELLRLFAGLTAAFSATVIAVDDIQWLDSQSKSILTSLALSPPPGCGVVFLGRPESLASLPAQLTTQNVTLGGLSERDAERLFNRLRPENADRALGWPSFAEVNRYAQGNPLALIELGRSRMVAPGAAGETTPAHRERGGTEGLLEDIARSRLGALRREARELLQFLSLLLPPAPVRYLRRFGRFDGASLDVLVEECRTALLLSRGEEDGLLGFSHDSIESLTRAEALRKPELIEAAEEVLREASEAGDDRALFALSHLVTNGEAHRGETHGLSRGANVALLTRAAERGLAFRSAAEALRFAEAALQMCDGDGDELHLRMVAHEAAYQLDDVAAMSRHFAHIYASRDRLRVNRARLLWISHAYAGSSFRGSLRIGWRALEDLGAISPNRDEATLLEEARTYLRRVRIASLERRLLSRPVSRSDESRLRVSVSARIMLSVFNVDYNLLAVLAYLIISDGLKNGRTPETGIAFIAWAEMEAAGRIDPSRLAALFTAATHLADSVDDPVARHSIHTYAEVFDLLWTRPYADGMQNLERLHREGIELGNFQFASHAAHLHVQALLYHGSPLEEVFEAIQAARAEMTGYHHYRTARALAKYAQAVESLLGRTSDPLSLTGSVIDETAYLQKTREQRDTLSLCGIGVLKVILAMYFGRPDVALRHYEELRRDSYTIGSLHDVAAFEFLRGLAAYRQGDAAAGREALRLLRRWARTARANHLHRVYVLAAEDAFSRSRPRRGFALYERARQIALARDYPHEAALIAEHHAYQLRSRRAHTARVDELLYLAHGLYARWGAVHAAERVRNSLGWHRSPLSLRPLSLEKGFVRRLVEAGDTEELLRRTSESLFRFSGAWEALLLLAEPTRLQSFTTHSGATGEAAMVTTVDAPIHPALAQLLEHMPAQGDGRIQTVHIDAETHSVYAVESTVVEGTSLRFLLVSSPGGGSFSQAIRARVSAGITLAGALVQLRGVLLRSREQADSLADARQAVARGEDYRKTLFGSLTDGLLLLQADLGILYHNPASRPFLQEPDDGWPPSLAPELAQAVSAATSTGIAGPQQIEVARNGRELRVSITVAPSPDDSSSVIYAVSIQDITETRRQEAALRRREQQLIVADRMSSLGMLSATIAHEVSNPNHILQLNAQSLTVLLGRLRDITPAGTGEIEEAERVVAQILEGSSRIEQVVGHVKEYARSGRAREEAELVSVADVCERALRFSRIMAAQFTDHLSYQPGAGIPRIRAFGGLLEQAIINLIKNAGEALLDRSGRVRLATSYDSPTEDVVISVADDGPGIDPAVRRRLGEPFESGRRDEGGTGLGLSIVRAILDRHGGRLLLRDDDDFSTVVELRLPAATDAAS